MKNKILTICLLLIFQTLVSQNVWQWGITNDTNNYSNTMYADMSLDKNDDIVVTGNNTNTLSIGGLTVNSANANNSFIAKISKNGGINWLNYAKNSMPYDFPRHCNDTHGNIYVVGAFTNTFVVSGQVLTAPVNTTMLYLLKYSGGGALLWAKVIGRGALSPRSIKMNSAQIYIAGVVTSSFSIGSFTVSSFPSVEADIFLAKLDTSGIVLSSTLYGKEKSEQVYDMASSPDGGMIMSGVSTSSLLTLGTFSLQGPPTGKVSQFIFKVSASGTVLWAKRVNDNTPYGFYGFVCTDPVNNIYFTSIFKSPTLAVDNLTLTTTSSADNGMLIKYDPNGNALWVRSFGGNGCSANSRDIPYSVCTDLTGEVYVSGSFQSPVFTIGSYTLANNTPICSMTQLFVAHFDGAGTVRSVLSGGGSQGYINGYKILVDRDYNLVVGGDFVAKNVSLGPVNLKGIDNNIYSRLFVAKASNVFTSVNEMNKVDQVSVWPIPSGSQVTFKSEYNRIKTIDLYNLEGRLISSHWSSSSTVELSIATLAAGIYLARVTLENQQMFTTKIVKEE